VLEFTFAKDRLQRFPGTECRIELTPPAFVLRIQVVEPLLEGLAVGTPDGFHAGIITPQGKVQRR
jgi:hypothetical protein